MAHRFFGILLNSFHPAIFQGGFRSLCLMGRVPATQIRLGMNSNEIILK